MTNVQKFLIGAVIVLGLLVAITIPPSMEFYFDKKNTLDPNGKDLKDITPEKKTSETVKEITLNNNS